MSWRDVTKLRVVYVSCWLWHCRYWATEYSRALYTRWWYIQTRRGYRWWHSAIRSRLNILNLLKGWWMSRGQDCTERWKIIGKSLWKTIRKGGEQLKKQKYMCHVMWRHTHYPTHKIYSCRGVSSSVIKPASLAWTLLNQKLIRCCKLEWLKLEVET